MRFFGLSARDAPDLPQGSLALAPRCVVRHYRPAMFAGGGGGAAAPSNASDATR